MNDRWPGQSEEESPDCGPFLCSFADDQEDVFTSDQRRVVMIYEVLYKRGVKSAADRSHDQVFRPRKHAFESTFSSASAKDCSVCDVSPSVTRRGFRMRLT